MLVLDQIITEDYALYHGDAIPIVAALPDRSIDFICYSPPFSSLYTYSNSERDMGNCRDEGEFYAHFLWLARDLARVLKAGRLMAIHCMDLPTLKSREGHIGLKDFPAELRRIFEEAGLLYHSKVTIWKDPVTQMQRTKALGLLHKQLLKDSAMSRQGLPDYLLIMRQPEPNPEPIAHTATDFPVRVWQEYASPVWMDIDPGDTLQKESAREHEDEKHIAPLQLEVIRRAVRLWTNPGDRVLSPFMGIGSEGVASIELGRRFVGVELKPSYYRQAVANLARAVAEAKRPTLFDLAAVGG
jgi:DNA modification methylase